MDGSVVSAPEALKPILAWMLSMTQLSITPSSPTVTATSRISLWAVPSPSAEASLLLLTLGRTARPVFTGAASPTETPWLSAGVWLSAGAGVPAAGLPPSGPTTTVVPQPARADSRSSADSSRAEIRFSFI